VLKPMSSGMPQGLLLDKIFREGVATTKGKVETYLTFEFEDTGVSKYALSSGGEAPMESLSLNFTKMTFTFTSHDPSISGSPETVGYDLPHMKAE
jgi:type VI secretion system secreted protein Hcp